MKVFKHCRRCGHFMDSTRCYRCAPTIAVQRSARCSKSRARLAAIKSIAGCTDCGTHDPDVLEWDHLPEYVKSFNISQGVARNRHVIAREMMKCEVVCANCHVKRTVRRRREAAVATMALPLRSQHR